MTLARCKPCGRQQRWSQQRGARLEDEQCEKCGGALEALHAGFVPANKGRKFETCAHCGRAGLALVKLDYPWRVRHLPPGPGNLYPAGVPVHAHHDPRHASWRASHELADHALPEGAAEAPRLECVACGERGQDVVRLAHPFMVPGLPLLRRRVFPAGSAVHTHHGPVPAEPVTTPVPVATSPRPPRYHRAEV